MPGRLVANRYTLTTVLRHLVDNAVSFARPGVPPVVVMSATRQDAMWVVRVEDNGLGIDPRDVDRVFRPYKRLAAPGSERASGNGMGLAVCRQLVRRHGGEIALRPADGHGCVAEFSLPLFLEEPA
jgi:signal transduction histidine kinase